MCCYAGATQVSVLLGQVSVLLGQVSVLLGQVCVLLGQVSVLLGQVSVLLGQVSVLLGQVSDATTVPYVCTNNQTWYKLMCFAAVPQTTRAAHCELVKKSIS
jgi:hypothetical protein